MIGQSVDISCMNLASPPPVTVVLEVGCDGLKCGQFTTLPPTSPTPPISVMWEVGHDGSECGQFMHELGISSYCQHCVGGRL